MALIAERLNRIKPSATMGVSGRAQELKAQGMDIISLGAGEPDFDTPDNAKEAAISAIKLGETKYTLVPGTLALREAISAKFKRENGLDYAPSQIQVASGGKQSIYNAIMATVEEGDEVIIPAPYWVSYPDIVLLAGGTPVIVEGYAENDFKITSEQLEEAITPKTKWLLINSPSNPTGGIWSNESIIKLLKIAKKHNWAIISDECYERLVYDGTFTSTEKLNQDNNIGAEVITCISLSKTYAMTGWRIGYSAGPRDIIKAMSKIQGQATSCANSIGQKASIEALIGDQSCVEDMKRAFKERRDLIVRLLNKIKGVTCRVPGGAFYVFPDFSYYLGMHSEEKLLKDTFDISEYILDCAKVVTVPGDGFGSPGHIRFSYATSTQIIKKGIGKVESALKKLKSKE
mgnify:CR=1 FL=1